MTIGDILRRNGGPGLFILNGPMFDEKLERGGAITNIANLSDTWGKMQPVTAGNIRVGGAQVWASQFYNLISEISYKGIPLYPAAGGGGINNNPKEVVTTQGMAEPAVDVAYSFGVNAIGVARILTKIRFDGEIIYDASKPDVKPKFAFNIYYGIDEVQDPAIKAVLADRTPYYPDQIYIVFQQVTRYSAAHLPTSVDAEFRTETLSSNEAVTSTFNSIAPGRVLPDYARRIFYVYRSTPGYGSFDKYDMDTYEKLSTAVINSLSERNQSDGYVVPDALYGEGLQWFPASRVVFGQQNYFGGRSRVRAIDPETGNELGGNGFNEQNFGGRDNSEIGGMPRWSEFEARVFSDGPNGGKFYAGQRVGNGRLYFYSFTGSAASGQVTITRALKEGLYVGDKTVKGNGVVYVANAQTRKINKLLDDGTLTAFADAPGDPALGDLVYYNGFVASIEPFGIRGFGSDGKEIYKVQRALHGVGNFYAAHFVANSNVSDGKIAWISGFSGGSGLKLNVLDIPTGDLIEYILGEQPNNPRASFWDGKSARAISLNTATNSFQVQAPVKEFGGTILLRDFIRALYVGTGRYAPADITFENINDRIYGAGVFSVVALSDVINNICSLYRIEKFEGEKSVNFYRNRLASGLNDVTFTINTNEMALLTENDKGIVLQSRELSTGNKTAEIELSFLDIDNEFIPNKVVWRRPDALATETGKLTLSVPIVMSKNDATLLIQNVFADNEAADVEHSFRLPPSHNYYGKGDLVKIIHNQFVIICQIREETLNRDFSLSCVADGIVLQTGAVTEIPDVPTGSQPIAGSGAGSLFEVFDIPALLADQNPADASKFVQYAFVYGSDPTWNTGYLARRIGDGDYTSLFATLIQQGVYVYRTTNALTDKRWITDSDTLNVTPVFGAWPTDGNKTATELQAEPAANIALYGAPGRWEVVRFASIAGGVVSGVIRGLRGTEGAAGLHVAGDAFVPVGGALVAEERPASAIGQAEAYRAASPADDFTAQPASARTPAGASLRPWAPFDVRGARSPGGAVAVTWQRRDRKGSGWGGAAPQSETAEAYEAELLRPDGTVLRTFLNLAAPELSYSAADQTTDGTSSSAKLTFVVYQISSVVGRGFGNKAEINV